MDVAEKERQGPKEGPALDKGFRLWKDIWVSSRGWSAGYQAAIMIKWIPEMPLFSLMQSLYFCT